MQQAVRMYSFLFLDSIFVVVSAMAVVGSIANMQFFVHVQELYTLEVTGQETVAQVKSHGASLEGITPEDQVSGTLWRMSLPLASVGWRTSPCWK